MIEFEAETKELMPKQATRNSAGMDIKTVERIEVAPNSFINFRTGVKIKYCDWNTFLLMELRSSLRFKKHLTQLGSGIIDADFRGEIMGLIFNPTSETVVIEAGERVAQLIPLKLAYDFLAIENLSYEEREGGFGSTGNR